MKRSHSNTSRKLSRRRRAQAPSSQQLRKRRSRLEKLEDRHLLAAISGEVYIDLNEDGVRQSDEEGVSEVRVYLDDNVNGRLDINEQTTETDAEGIYSFAQVDGGDYQVRIVPGPGRVQLSPALSYGVHDTVIVEDDGTVLRAAQIFQMDVDGTVQFLGQPTTERLDGVVRVADGNLVAINSRANAVFRIDPNNGEITRIGNSNFDLTGGLAYDPIADRVYTMVRGSISEAQQVLATIDPNTAITTLIGSGINGLNSVSDITFDRLNQRIIGFDDTDDQFFAFDLFGNGQTLSFASRPLDARSMTIAGSELLPAGADPSFNSYVQLFDADGRNGTESVLVDLSSGLVTDSINSDRSIKPLALDRPRSGDNPLSVSVTQFQTLSEVDFGISNDVIGFRISAINPLLGPGFLGTEGLTVVGGAIDEDIIQVTLNRAPDTDVVLDLSLVSDLGGPTGALIDATSLTFTPDNWDTPQLITVTPDPDNPVSVISRSTLTISVNRLASDLEWGFLTPQTASIRVLPPVNPIVFDRPVINEVLFEGGTFQSVSRTTDQYIELRGQPFEVLPAGTYLVTVAEDDFFGNDEGTIRTVFDLSNQSFGSNGFLVLLQAGNTYQPAFGTRVVESTQEGFIGLPGNIFSTVHSDGSLMPTFDSSSFMLIHSDVPPTINSDIDTNSDGILDPSGVASSWTIHDSVAFHRFNSFRSSFTYSSIVAIDARTSSNSSITTPGATVLRVDDVSYGGRVGDSFGSSAEDWVFGAVGRIGTNANIAGNELEAGELEIVEDFFDEGPSIDYLFDANLDHIGESNFVAGVRGEILLAPSNAEIAAGTPEDLRLPGEGITILADTNGNGQVDDLIFTLEPDSLVPPFDPNNPQLQDLTYSATTAFPGVTISNENFGRRDDDIHAGRELVNRNAVANRVFDHSGLFGFDEFEKLRFDFARPIKSASITAISDGFTSIVSFGRLDAYNSAGQIVATTVSGPLTNSRREVITVSAPGEEIVRLEAYDDNFGFGGFFDTLTYVQSEPTAVTDQNGAYQINGLIPGDYEVSVLSGVGSAALLGTTAHPFSVSRYENFLFRDVYRPNSPPTASDLTIPLDENPPVGTNLGQVPAIDADNDPIFGAATPLLFEIASGASTGVIVQPVTGELFAGPDINLDFEAGDQQLLTVRVTDSLGASAISRVTLSLRDVNEAPDVSGNELIVTEGIPSGSSIGRIDAVDPDAGLAQTLSFSVIGGDAAPFFSVHPTTGVVTLNDPEQLNFEQTNVMTLRVRVSDDAVTPASVEIDQVIRILDENDPPSLGDTQFTISEAAIGELFKLTAVDPDEGQTHQFAIVGGTAAGLMRVDADGSVHLLEAGTLDFEQQPQLTLQVNVADDGQPSLASTETITINLLNADELAQLATRSADVSENVTGIQFATLSIVDPEGFPADYAFDLLPGPSADFFRFAPISGALSVAPGVQLDFETQATHELSFEIVDVTGRLATTEQTFTVNVINANEAPQVLTQEIIVSEIPRGGEQIGRLLLEDPEGDTLIAEFQGTGTAEQFFDLDPNTHIISVKQGVEFTFDVELPSVLTVDVVARDENNNSPTQSITITLNDVNEPPVFDTSAAGDVLNGLSVDSGNFFSVTLPADLAVDPDPDPALPFQYFIFTTGGGLPDWLDYDVETRTLSGKPGPFDAGILPLTVRALERGPFPLSDDFDFSLTVNLGDTPLTNGHPRGLDRFDVDNNGSVAPLDALRVINFLEANGEGIVDIGTLQRFRGFVDVSGDGRVTSLDALQIINEINRRNGVNSGAEPIATSASSVANAVSAELEETRRRERAVDAALAADLGNSGLF